MILTTKCPFCGKTRNIDIDRVAWKEYLCGKRIQDAFPDLDADTREAIQTGICPECFPKEEENE